jgi:hypothetical protein
MAKNVHMKIVFHTIAAVILNFDSREKQMRNITDPKET